MSFKVFIPTAGLGSRLGNLTKEINKSLISVSNKPVISFQFEKFPKDSEFVIALGYKGKLVREYLDLVYSKFNLRFVDINPYQGKGSGLGLTLLRSKKFLQEPFIFISCDTLVIEPIQSPKDNWIGYSQNKEDLEKFRTVKLDKNNQIKKILKKGIYEKNQFPYIGLCSIFNYDIFWDAMQNKDPEIIEEGEVYGLNHLVESKIVNSNKFTWFDTGSKEGLSTAEKKFNNEINPNILEKESEKIWFVNDKVVKFSIDTNFIKKRVERSFVLKGYVPNIKSFSKNMYFYNLVEGKLMSDVINPKVFKELLKFTNKFWKKINLEDQENIKFKNACLDFYKKKTFSRVNQFFESKNIDDTIEEINGVNVPSLRELLNKCDWDFLKSGVPSRFHGDFHFENILWQESKNNFIFLDWRQSFGGLIDYGDIYYDFAKLLHGLIINHGLIKENLFMIKREDKKIEYEFLRKESLISFERLFFEWLTENEYSLSKVNLITSLIFLNIAPLHHKPYDELLFYLGKKMLYENLN